jgi:hypothetical protein
MNQQVTLTRQAIRTPRAAAEAGIIFSVLFATSMVLIRLTLPEELRATSIATWLQGNTTTISLALTLVPFAGIAFLWFMGVVRSRLGTLEDQFFSTVFFGSGLLFLAMMFASAAIAGGILISYAIEADTLIMKIERTNTKTRYYPWRGLVFKSNNQRAESDISQPLKRHGFSQGYSFYCHPGLTRNFMEAIRTRAFFIICLRVCKTAICWLSWNLSSTNTLEQE